MKIAIFGMGYIGCINAVLLAERGHEIYGVEVSEDKIELLKKRKLPILEPQLNELFDKQAESQFSFFSNSSELPRDLDVILVCVGTPSTSTGSVDLGFIKKTIAEIGEYLKSAGKQTQIIVRSTVPPGTSLEKLIPLLEKTSGKTSDKDFQYYYYPEFIREGSGVEDFLNPSLDVVATHSDTNIISKLFSNSVATQKVSFETAEYIKYMNNSFHALKVAFANEASGIAKAYGVNTEELTGLFLSDKRLNISEAYLKPGPPYGGPCLTKDLSALCKLAEKKGLRSPLLGNISESNVEHIKRVANAIESFDCNQWVVFGVSFKENTDDIRRSPMTQLISKFAGGPSYKKRFKFFVLDKLEIQEKFVSEIGSKQVEPCRFPVPEDHLKGILLASKKLDQEELNFLKSFDGPIVDLGYFDFPIEVTQKPNYVRVC